MFPGFGAARTRENSSVVAKARSGEVIILDIRESDEGFSYLSCCSPTGIYGLLVGVSPMLPDRLEWDTAVAGATVARISDRPTAAYCLSAVQSEL